ncbi:MAG: L,D-transpeptidase [Polyangiaceae bacterium]|nr:L,D-transpeptidase [Polyangiaceae bacterium]
MQSLRSGPHLGAARARAAALVALAVAAAACARRDPPGTELGAAGDPVVVRAGPPSDEVDAGAPAPEAGSEADHLPFVPDGQTRIASLALRTWVYTDVGRQRTRYGYLRAGEVVDGRGPPIVNEGCAGGWYRVNPRGFVCLGKGATLDAAHPAAALASVRPVRGQALPYRYTMASDTPPLRYVRLPTLDEQRKAEGDDVVAHSVRWREHLPVAGVAALLGEPGEPPDALRARTLVKPYGTTQHLHLGSHSGRAAADSGFALLQVVSWESRWFALTTEHDLIALDRTKVVRPSPFRGVELGPDEDLPVGFVESAFAQRLTFDDAGHATPSQSYGRRQGIKLTGVERTGSGTFLETRDGGWVAPGALRVVSRRDSFPSFATGGRKWIDISITQQTLVAYEGKRAVYVTLVSTGRGGMGDPEKVFATVRGTFMIVSKHVTATMDGEDDKSDSYNLADVPFVQYFHKGYALHGTYWHDDFGRIRSHGCVNLSPIDAAWLFEWTDPSVPPSWHGVINKERGTVVNIRP